MKKNYKNYVFNIIVENDFFSMLFILLTMHGLQASVKMKPRYITTRRLIPSTRLTRA